MDYLYANGVPPRMIDEYCQNVNMNGYTEFLGLPTHKHFQFFTIIGVIEPMKYILDNDIPYVFGNNLYTNVIKNHQDTMFDLFLSIKLPKDKDIYVCILNNRLDCLKKIFNKTSKFKGIFFLDFICFAIMHNRDEIMHWLICQKDMTLQCVRRVAHNLIKSNATYSIIANFANVVNIDLFKLFDNTSITNEAARYGNYDVFIHSFNIFNSDRDNSDLLLEAFKGKNIDIIKMSHSYFPMEFIQHGIEYALTFPNDKALDLCLSNNCKLHCPDVESTIVQSDCSLHIVKTLLQIPQMQISVYNLMESATQFDRCDILNYLLLNYTHDNGDLYGLCQFAAEVSKLETLQNLVLHTANVNYDELKNIAEHNMNDDFVHEWLTNVN